MCQQHPRAHELPWRVEAVFCLVKVWGHFPETMSEDPDRAHFDHYCEKCVAAQEGTVVEESRVMVNCVAGA